MPTPPKPFMVLTTEGKSHRTKAELEQRRKGEESLITGKPMKERLETKENPAAHKEFRRINALLKQIKKNDALYEPIINRYCMLQAECIEFEEKRERFYKQMCELEEREREYLKHDDFSKYVELQTIMQKNLISMDRQLQAKRGMLLSMEKECTMTIASALRSIPKKVEHEEDPLEGLNKYGN